MREEREEKKNKWKEESMARGRKGKEGKGKEKKGIFNQLV